jgi:hypothetical protein
MLVPRVEAIDRLFLERKIDFETEANDWEMDVIKAVASSFGSSMELGPSPLYQVRRRSTFTTRIYFQTETGFS